MYVCVVEIIRYRSMYNISCSLAKVLRLPCQAHSDSIIAQQNVDVTKVLKGTPGSHSTPWRVQLESSMN